MPDQDDTFFPSRGFPAPAITGAGGSEFVATCDWGENWGRIALTNKATGAEVLIVVPFRAPENAPRQIVEQQLYEQARPQLSKAVHVLIAKAWPQDG